MKPAVKQTLLGLIALPIALYGLALVVAIDPDERRPGLRLSGGFAEAPADWSTRLAPREKIWIQTRTPWGIPHSVTTISFVADGDLYVPCARCSGKRWPKNVARDPHVVVKVGESLFARRAVRVEDREVLAKIFDGRDFDASDVWLFRMEAPDQDDG